MKHIVLALIAIALYPAVASAGHHGGGFGFFFSIGDGGRTYCAPPAPTCDPPCYSRCAFVSPGWQRTYAYAPQYESAAPVYCEPRIACVAPPPMIVYRSPIVVYSPRVYCPAPYTAYYPRVTDCYPR
ncbi:MAG TPA: hypothetical protein VLI90_01885 [Tepidisphaeraceae bacterium]|nr:hypothetical protein [Tepidisphaeraceae bacterium]